MSVWAVVSGLAAGLGWFSAGSRDRAAERRRATLPEDAARGRWLRPIRGYVISAAQAQRLAVLGQPERQYMRDLAIAIGVGVLIGGVGLHSWFWGLLLGMAGYGWAWLRVAGKHARWQKEVVQGVPTLVRVLKLRMNAGENVTLAVTRAGRFVPGPMAVEWARLVTDMHAGASLETALAKLGARIDDRNVTAVLTRLRTYHRTGLPAEPFGDLAEHMTQVYMVQQQSRMRALTSPLVLYVLLAMLGATITALLPAIIVQVIQALAGSPL